MEDKNSDIAMYGMNAVEMLRSIIRSIYKEAPDHSNIKELAMTGSFIADSQHDFLDVIHEKALLVEEK